MSDEKATVLHSTNNNHVAGELLKTRQKLLQMELDRCRQQREVVFWRNLFYAAGSVAIFLAGALLIVAR